jgi:cytochrome c556
MTKKKLTRPLMLLALVFSAGVDAQEGPVKYRQSLMSAVGGHAGAVAQIAYGGVPYKDYLAGHAHALVEVSKQVTIAFKEEIITEDPPTRAKAAIWEDWDEFEAKAGDLEKAAAAVAQAAESGDTDAVAAKLDPLWDACKGCHKKFRQKQE